MNTFRSLAAVTRRALRINYVSPSICVLGVVSSGSGTGSGVSALLDILAVTRKDGPTALTFEAIDPVSVRLTWTPKGYIYSYVVYIATTELGPYTQITANVIGNTFLHTPVVPGTYYYKVTGVEPDAGETHASNIVGPVTLP